MMHLERGWFGFVDGFVNGIRGQSTDLVKPLEVAGVAALSIRESVVIRR